MPRRTPEVSYTQIRNYAERWVWTDATTGRIREGVDPPATATDRSRKPFHLKAITKDGRIIEGDVVTLNVRPYGATTLRDVKFVTSGEVRMIDDNRIIYIDGIRFISH